MADTAALPMPAARRPSAWTSLAALARGFGPGLIVLAVAVAMRCFSDLCGDVSWLLTVGEKLLAGGRPYVDIIETNPPASFLMYVPALLLGRGLGIAPEAAVVGLVFLAVLASLALAWRLLDVGGLRHRASEPVLLAAALLLFLVVPAHVFAQREHVAAIAALPLLAAYAVRASGARIDPASAVLAGLGGGVAVAIKPHFALAVALPLAYAAWQARSRPGGWIRAVLQVETVTVGCMAACCAVGTVLLFPAYVADILPLLAAVYVPAKMPLLAFLANPSLLLFFVALIVAWLVDPAWHREPVTAALMLGAAGFFAAMVIQLKGWPYHGYPAVALAMLACIELVARRIAAAIGPADHPAGAMPLRLALAAAAMLLLAGFAMAWFARNGQIPAIARTVERLAPPHPRIIAISGDSDLGHPLTRQVHGQWAGRLSGTWIAAFAGMLLDDAGLDEARRRTIASYAKYNRDVLVEDIARNRPDVILVQNDDWRAWIASHAEIAAALRPYREAAVVDGVSMLLRKDDGRP